MNPIVIGILVIAVIVIIVMLNRHFTSPERYFKNKNYVKAFEKSLKSPEKHRTILIDSLTKIIANDKEQILSLKSRNVEDQAKALKLNQALSKKIKISSDYTNGLFQEEYESLKKEEDSLKNKVSKGFFEKGTDAFESFKISKDKDEAEEAYLSFRDAKNHGNQDPHIDSLLKESLQAAQKVYVIHTDKELTSKYTDMIDNNLEKLTENATEFIQVYYNSNPSGDKQIDCNIKITFTPFNSNIAESGSNKEVIKKEITTSAHESPLMVECEKVTITRIKTATWPVLIEVGGSNNCKIKDGKINEKITSKEETVNYTGDERAFPNGDNPVVTREFKRDDEMAQELIHLIYDKLKEKIF